MPKTFDEGVCITRFVERPVRVFELLKEDGVRCSYQGVCKRVKVLHREGVLAKEGAEYAVSGEWLEDMKSFVDGLEKAESSVG